MSAASTAPPCSHLYHKFLYTYFADDGGPVLCSVRVFITDRHACVALTPVEETNQQLVNAIERIASDLQIKLRLPLPIQWIHCTPAGPCQWEYHTLGRSHGFTVPRPHDDFAVVTFITAQPNTPRPRLHSPRWQQIDRLDLETIIGGRWL
jgi:hypothetical protein